MIGFIIWMLVLGVIAGFVARALVPGDDSMSVGATIVLGIIGSFVGGFLADVLFRSDGRTWASAPQASSAPSSEPSSSC